MSEEAIVKIKYTQICNGITQTLVMTMGELIRGGAMDEIGERDTVLSVKLEKIKNP